MKAPPREVPRARRSDAWGYVKSCQRPRTALPGARTLGPWTWIDQLRRRSRSRSRAVVSNPSLAGQAFTRTETHDIVARAKTS